MRDSVRRWQRDVYAHHKGYCDDACLFCAQEAYDANHEDTSGSDR